jgi:hypothetical protein
VPGVESRRHQDQLGPERAHDRLDCAAIEVQQLRVAQAHRHRQVEREPRARAAPDLVEPARARIERVAVAAHVEHVAALLEAVLRAVAVVDVGVEDQHAPAAELGQRVLGRDGHVVEQAEAHRGGRLGVVAGRPHEREGPARGAGGDGLGRGDRRAGRQPRDLDAALARGGVGVEAHAEAGGALDRVHVGRAVRAQQLRARRRARGGRQRAGDGARCEVVEHGLQPRRVLRVPRPRIVLEEALVAHDERRRGCGRGKSARASLLRHARSSTA